VCFCVLCFRGTGWLLRRGDPESVGVKKEKENHAEGHEVHVDEEEDSAVIETPAGLHAADGVYRAGGRGKGGDDEQWGGAVVGEIREQNSDAEAQENECASA
jgi:hypothetical protein